MSHAGDLTQATGVTKMLTNQVFCFLLIGTGYVYNYFLISKFQTISQQKKQNEQRCNTIFKQSCSLYIKGIVISVLIKQITERKIWHNQNLINHLELFIEIFYAKLENKLSYTRMESPLLYTSMQCTYLFLNCGPICNSFSRKSKF